MSNEDESGSAEGSQVMVLASPEKTQEVGMSIDNILKEKHEIVDVLTGASKERRLLLKELMMTAYIGGFFAGTHHAHRDPERSEN